jgi:NAD(P)H dehydrogenase (quinone)
MHVYIVYAHPSDESFTHAVLSEFVRGLKEAGHSVEICDLYAIGFKATLSRDEYKREVGSDPDSPVADDVQTQHIQIDQADALAFVYPLWWGDCPAQLKGWFDRVLAYGYAYTYEDGKFLPRLQTSKALVVCTAGDAVETLEANGVAPSMRSVMLDNRLRGSGVKNAELVILGGTALGGEETRARNLETAYRLGKEF